MSSKRPPKKAPAKAGTFENPHKRRFSEAAERWPEKYAALAAGNREWAQTVASKLESGDDLNDADRSLLAAVVRHWAGQISDTPKKAPGRPRDVDYMLVAAYYWKALNDDGLSETEAREQIMMEFELDGPGHLERILQVEFPSLSKRGKKNS